MVLPLPPVPSPALHTVIRALGTVLLGKEHQVRLALACLLARGHLLIEDLPGVGKTTLAEALARSFRLAFKRVSFTSDLLPADLTGLSVFDPARLEFEFQPGPLFSQVLLADEIIHAQCIPSGLEVRSLTCRRMGPVPARSCLRRSGARVM